MVTTRRTAWTLGVLLTVGLAVAGAEDLTVVSKVTTAKGGPTTSTQYLAAAAMRISSGDQDTIVDLDSGKIVQIDNKKKTYYVTTFEEMQHHFAQLQEMLSSNPVMAKMLGDVSDVHVEETTDTRDIAGYPCRKYLLSMGDAFKETLWVTTQLEVPVRYYDARKMLYAMMGPMATKFEKMLDEMKRIKGFALGADIDTRVMGMSASSVSEAVEVKKGPIPADVFQPPAGYKQVKSPLGK